jgi:hypothetical protein
MLRPSFDNHQALKKIAINFDGIVALVDKR